MTNLPFYLTPAAARRISALISQDETAIALRISVLGGGCSGFQYKMELCADSAEDDCKIELDGASVLIDAVSLPLIAGGTLDFIEDISGSYFQILNPNAVSSCGCGNSFST